jgi:transmembrane sensor
LTDTVPTQAAIWLARLERGLRPHEGVQLRQWLQRPEHSQAIVNSAKLYHGPDVVAVLAELVPVGFGNPPPPLPKQSRTFAIIVGTCLALMLVAVPIMTMKRPRMLPRDEDIYSTGPHEIRTIKLPDNSQAILNGESQLYVLYAAWVREATVAHGEVIFDLTLKRPKPFLIFAGGRHFEAPAGHFDVRVTGPETVQLTVLEGSVTVKGLPFQRPTTPAQARDFDPRVFADAAVGPMQSVLLDHGTLTRQAITSADLRSQWRWEPEQVVYVSP